VKVAWWMEDIGRILMGNSGISGIGGSKMENRGSEFSLFLIS